MLNSYRELKVWTKAIELVIKIYRLTDLFPRKEVFGLCSQMRRAAVSIPSNIAEGYTRKNRPEYRRFINISFASGAELETQITIANKLTMAPLKEFEKSEMLLTEVMKMLNKLSEALN